jgi:hypothetical protein
LALLMALPYLTAGLDSVMGLPRGPGRAKLPATAPLQAMDSLSHGSFGAAAGDDAGSLLA